MNLPNKLTVLRILMIPLFLVSFYVAAIPHHYLFALAVFALASLTDMLDGRIARSQGLVTDFGKIMDPLADKLLVVSALVSLSDIGWAPAIVVILIIAREFLVTSIRLIAAPKGMVIAADVWGKFKTVAQMVWVCTAMLLVGLLEESFLQEAGWISAVNGVLLTLAAALTVISGANYLIKNRKLFSDR